MDAKMKVSQFLKTSTEHDITTWLQVIPQASITPILPTIGLVQGEGVSQAKTAKTPQPPTSQTKESDVQPLPASSTQQGTPTPIPTQETVIIHNIKKDSDEDDKPIVVVENKRNLEKK